MGLCRLDRASSSFWVDGISTLVGGGRLRFFDLTNEEKSEKLDFLKIDNVVDCGLKFGGDGSLEVLKETGF